MFIRQLNYLVALDEYLHFGRAAQACCVSQPALSNGIRELERELGFPIIKRRRSFEGITPEGERIIVRAREVLAALERLRAQADLIRCTARGHLAIGMIPTAGRAATRIAAELRALVPGLTLELLALSNGEIIRRLKSRNLHFGILYSHWLRDEDCEKLPLFTEHYAVIASAGLDLPQPLSWAEIAALPLCLLNREMQNRQLLDECFRVAGVAPHVVLEVNTVQMLLAECRSGRVFSVVPLSALPPISDWGGLHSQEIVPQHTEQVCCARRREVIQPELVQTAWEIVARIDLESEFQIRCPGWEHRVSPQPISS